MAARNNSVASQSANIQQRANQIASQVEAEQGWLESKLKPKKITARYPITGKALLFATCGFGSLGDALFGYNSGKSLFAACFKSANVPRYYVRTSCQPGFRETVLQRIWWCGRQHSCCEPFDHGHLCRLLASLGRSGRPHRWSSR